MHHPNVLPNRGGVLLAVWLWRACWQSWPVWRTANPLFNDALDLALREAPALTANAAQVDAARQAAIPAGELLIPNLRSALTTCPSKAPIVTA